MSDLLVQIGSVYKAHGFKGMMKIRVIPEYMDDILHLDAIFIKTPSNTLPYFISSIEDIADDMALLQLEEITSKEEITPIIKCPILAREEDLEGELEEWESLVGYHISDKNIGEIGEIFEVIEMPHQEIAKVIYQEREILIPIHEDLIVEIDEIKKKILMDLPDGFFEVF
ncbi:MAG: ribosome maturation factor RimM [Chitinophagales bacterium]|nr:ribosome maturation factor RimM [Chitinophagales bacterium]MCZ2393558.1 ribosome maturation factor RimM [Chitinophagales bacterium]